jgi:hypothetical protein
MFRAAGVFRLLFLSVFFVIEKNVLKNNSGASQKG